MFLKGSKLYSIMFLKCPRCHQGKFLDAHPYRINRLNHVKDRCPVCDLNYKIEPSFYFGSMYISYAVGIALSGIVFAMGWLFWSLTLLQCFALISIVLVLAMPWIGAVAKSIWANLFMHYDSKIAHQFSTSRKNKKE